MINPWGRTEPRNIFRYIWEIKNMVKVAFEIMTEEFNKWCWYYGCAFEEILI